MKVKIVLLLMMVAVLPAWTSGQEDPAPSNDEGRKLTDVADASDANAPAEANAPSEAVPAQEDDSGVQFKLAANRISRQLTEARARLDALRKRITEVKIPLSRKLNKLEADLLEARREYQQATRVEGDRKLEVSNLEGKIEARKQEAAYLTDLLGEYVRNFESGMHIAEIQRYGQKVTRAEQAPDNDRLSQEKVYAIQTDLVLETLDRLEESVGGMRFAAEAVDPNGIVQEGTIALIGPVAMFRSADGSVVGSVEQKVGSSEPTVVEYRNPEDAKAAGEVIRDGKGTFPLDPTLGNAHKIEATQETLLEHISKGGPVMYPILGMAGAAMLVVLVKWVALSLTPRPRQRQIRDLLETVARGDENGARRIVERIKGPVGRMLRAGIEHIREPRELIEEVMYETVLSTKLKLQRMLPFVAIAAASAPLLGLLGTVTGIINTFQLIRVHGAGDVKTLSGGISEALITTEFGLIVAIPSLLLHAFLSRKAKGMTNEMEKTAVAFVNQVSKSGLAVHEDTVTREAPSGKSEPDSDRKPTDQDDTTSSGTSSGDGGDSSGDDASSDSEDQSK